MKINNFTKGFTLIEIIISLAIFTMVMIVALGAFLKIVDVNKRAQSIEMAVNSLTFAVEAMSRELRIGKSYEVSNTGDQVTFIGRYDTAVPPQPIYYAYRFSGNKIQRAVRVSVKPANTDFSDLTAINLKITSLVFDLKVGIVPMVRIYTSGEVQSVDKAKTTFDVQTAISQRLQ